MPSGKTHDALTLLLAVPVFAGGYVVSGSIAISGFLTAAYLFGGMMFGPDLDIVSSQQPRWGVFSSLWAPYRWFFAHRSRWSHGLIFGTLFRVVYFMGIATLLVLIAVYLYAGYAGGDLPRVAEVAAAWRQLGAFVKENLGANGLVIAFGGMWLGAAVHTLTDITVTYVRTGRVTGFL